jgi:hypothetical protein
MNDGPSLEQRLQLAQAREAWRPGPGESIAGTLIALDQRESNYGGTYPLLTIHADDGRVLDVHAYEAVLLDELAKLRPRVGERLGIAYLGKHAERGYHRYRVVVDRDTPAAIDWAQYSEQAAAELADLNPPTTLSDQELAGLRDTYRRSRWTADRLTSELRRLGIADTADIATAMRSLTRDQAARLAQAMAHDRAGLGAAS